MPAFATTRWTLIARAQGESDEARRALAELCQAYWQPIFAFVRRTHDADVARDLTQGFFVLLLERGVFQRVDRSRGRFRSFLLVALRRFLAGNHEHSTAQKRGGGQLLLSIDTGAMEGRISGGHVDETPERLYERTWAETVMGRAMERLRQQHATAGTLDRFEHFRGLLTDTTPSSTAEVAATLGMAEGAVRTAVSRLRERYRAALLAEVADTIATKNEVEEELQELLRAVVR